MRESRERFALSLLIAVATLAVPAESRAQSPRTGSRSSRQRVPPVTALTAWRFAAASNYPVIPPDFTACTFSTREPRRTGVGARAGRCARSAV